MMSVDQVVMPAPALMMSAPAVVTPPVVMSPAS